MAKDVNILTDFDITPYRSPDRDLMAAVLAVAIQDTLSKDFNERSSAYRFLKSRKRGNEYTLTFVKICEFLDLDADSIENAVLSNKVKITKSTRLPR